MSSREYLWVQWRGAQRCFADWINGHYYKNVDLSRLGNPCCPGFPTGNASPGQKRVPFCPGSGNRDKRGPFVPVGNTNRDKRARQRTWLAHPFVPVGVTNWDKRSIFFPVFLFSIIFLFQLYFCISIKLMYWNSVCMISTNIYIYIVTYIIFVLDSFHI